MERYGIRICLGGYRNLCMIDWSTPLSREGRTKNTPQFGSLSILSYDISQTDRIIDLYTFIAISLLSLTSCDLYIAEPFTKCIHPPSLYRPYKENGIFLWKVRNLFPFARGTSRPHNLIDSKLSYNLQISCVICNRCYLTLYIKLYNIPLYY